MEKIKEYEVKKQFKNRLMVSRSKLNVSWSDLKNGPMKEVQIEYNARGFQQHICCACH